MNEGGACAGYNRLPLAAKKGGVSPRVYNKQTMSVIEDMRKVLQDFLAPELRALTARMDAADKIAEARYQEIKANAEARHQEVKANSEALRQEVVAFRQEVMLRFDNLKNSLELDKRVEKLESRQSHHPS